MHKSHIKVREKVLDEKNWRLGQHGPLSKFGVIVIIISFLLAPDFYRLEC